MKNKYLNITLLLSPLLIAPQLTAAESAQDLNTVLSQNYACSDTIIIRSQALTSQQIESACLLLQTQEAKFHLLFGTLNKPVTNDNNHSMRANVYHSREDYIANVTAHFDVPSDNGGMYLEGFPWVDGNQAEFVAYEKKGQVWNLAHEYVHYLDGRFNLYGDFCASLHDSHSAPEYCPKPAPLYPHTVWWSEGIAEYISLGDDNPKAIKVIGDKNLVLSDLFNTSYESNGGGDRVYRWGYLAVRFMIENHKNKIDEMLTFTRKGDYPRYQALVNQWGTSMDAEFQVWLTDLTVKN
ncbi:collagenase [Shewanella gelidimarina]|uniref:collagenase n=1 Tax=Shewanella gelidimarina TaxID=56813 RepID=UPI002010BED6|nr:collagenase [Shewanella gelidimarina]MCL1057030.1 collagenase [Shewanella gelidimarina]